MRTESSLVAALLFVAVVSVVSVESAAAHTKSNCNVVTRYSVHIPAKAILSHAANPNYHRARMRTMSSNFTDACGNDFYVATNVNDVYVATYASKYQNGSWRQCSKNVRGWRGANVGSGEWWNAKVQNYNWDLNCDWYSRTVRSHTVAKAYFTNGETVTVHTYSGNHLQI